MKTVFWLSVSIAVTTITIVLLFFLMNNIIQLGAWVWGLTVLNSLLFINLLIEISKGVSTPRHIEVVGFFGIVIYILFISSVISLIIMHLNYQL